MSQTPTKQSLKIGITVTDRVSVVKLFPLCHTAPPHRGLHTPAVGAVLPWARTKSPQRSGVGVGASVPRRCAATHELDKCHSERSEESLSRIANGLIVVEMPRKKALGMTRMSKFQLSRMTVPVMDYSE